MVLFDETLIKIQSNKKAFGVLFRRLLIICFLFCFYNYTPYERQCVSNAIAFP